MSYPHAINLAFAVLAKDTFLWSIAWYVSTILLGCGTENQNVFSDFILTDRCEIWGEATLGANAVSCSEGMHLIGSHCFKVTYIHTSQMSYTAILNHISKASTDFFFLCFHHKNNTTIHCTLNKSGLNIFVYIYIFI